MKVMDTYYRTNIYVQFWTLDYQRNVYRRIPKEVDNNGQLYEKNKCRKLEKKITRCRLKCLGKLASQPENISAKKALRYGHAPGVLKQK